MEGYVDGPSSIEMRLFNVISEVNVSNINQSTPMSIDILYTAVAKQVAKGIFSITSVNASLYFFTLVCQILVTKESLIIRGRTCFRHRGKRGMATLFDQSTGSGHDLS